MAVTQGPRDPEIPLTPALRTTVRLLADNRDGLYVLVNLLRAELFRRDKIKSDRYRGVTSKARRLPGEDGDGALFDGMTAGELEDLIEKLEAGMQFPASWKAWLQTPSGRGSSPTDLSLVVDRAVPVRRTKVRRRR